jgi:hypothetical protein
MSNFSRRSFLAQRATPVPSSCPTATTSCAYKSLVRAGPDAATLYPASVSLPGRCSSGVSGDVLGGQSRLLAPATSQLSCSTTLRPGEKPQEAQTAQNRAMDKSTSGWQPSCSGLWPWCFSFLNKVPLTIMSHTS